MSNETAQREQLAAYAHEAWSGWMKYLFSKCEKKKDELIIPAWAVQRWTRQRITSYAFLPEEEKESDRAEADKMLAIISGSTPREADELELLHPSLADSAAPCELPLPWRKIKDAAHCYIVDAVDEPVFAEADYDETAIDAIVEAVNAYWQHGGSVVAIIENRDKEIGWLRQRVAELEGENEQLNNQHASDVNTIMEQEALLKAKEAIIKGTVGLHRVVKELTTEITRLREELVQIEIRTTSGDGTVNEIARRALKGVEGETGNSGTRNNQAIAESPQSSQAERSSEVSKDADTSIQQAQTPLSEPLKSLKPLETRQILWSVEDKPSDEDAILAGFANYNFARGDEWSAEIVEAIAELDWHLRHKGDLMNNLNDKIGRYKRDAAAQIAKLEQKVSDAAILAGLYRKEVAAMQEQIDSLWERTDIYVDLQEKQREQISAQADLQDEMQVAIGKLETQVERQTQAGKAAWMMGQAKKIDALTEAVLAIDAHMDWNMAKKSAHELNQERRAAVAKLREMKGGE